MKALPNAVLHLLESLPEETCKIILNTNHQGHWEIEVFSRYVLDEPASRSALTPSTHTTRPSRQSRTSY